jgi:hypothetical protein
VLPVSGPPGDSLQESNGGLFKKLIFIYKNIFMAIVGNSIFDIQGKLGDLVYYRYRGKRIVRKAPVKRRNNFSQLQMEQQAKFALVANFIRPLYDFLKITYKIYSRSKSGFQKAFSENYNNALTGAYPSYSLDYSKVQLGNVSLPNALECEIKSTVQGKLIFTWSGNEVYGSLISDKLYYAIYCEKLNRWIHQFGCAERCKNIYGLDLSFFSGARVQVYMGFMSDDRKKVSTPLYIGNLKVL